MWEEDCLYRHTNNTDVAFEIIHQREATDQSGRHELSVSWWNIGNCHKPWPMGISQTIYIKQDDVGNWNKMEINELGPKSNAKALSVK